MAIQDLSGTDFDRPPNTGKSRHRASIPLLATIRYTLVNSDVAQMVDSRD
jgi:hypothetical protein